MLKNVLKMIFKSWKKIDFFSKKFQKKSKIFKKSEKKNEKKSFFFEFQFSAPLFLRCPAMYWPSLTVCTGPDALSKRRKFGDWRHAGSRVP